MTTPPLLRQLVCGVRDDEDKKEDVDAADDENVVIVSRGTTAWGQCHAIRVISHMAQAFGGTIGRPLERAPSGGAGRLAA